MGGKKPLRRPLWPPTRATASNYYPLGLDGAGGAAKPLLRAPKKPAPLHGRLPAFSGAVDAFERARKCFLEWRYFFSIILSEFLKNRVALQWRLVFAGKGIILEIKNSAHKEVRPPHQSPFGDSFPSQGKPWRSSVGAGLCSYKLPRKKVKSIRISTAPLIAIVLRQLAANPMPSVSGGA